MPPRHAYWTIIVDDQPTSFRAHDVEELLPTFNRLREKHPTAQLKWFERGQLFETRDAAREQGFGSGERRWEGPRPGKDWRPGGDHRDPRQKFKDAKKAKWDRYKQNLRSRWEDKKGGSDLPPPQPDRGDHTPPHGDPIRPKLKPRRDLGAPAAMRQDSRDQPREARKDDRSREFRRDDRRGGWKPKGAPRDDRERRPWGAKPGRKPFGTNPSRKPFGAKPFGAKPSGGGFRKKPFGSGPPRGPRKKRRDEEK